MLLRLFLIVPIIMCLVWTWYLNKHNYTAKQGLTGFAYIFAFNGILIGFFSLMIYITSE